MPHKYHVLTGPTASGKTALLLEVLSGRNALVISADSRQVYRQMDIGTGKASPAERNALPHRLIDIADPGDDYSAFSFVIDAATALRDARESGSTVWVCGGTGLYIRSLVEGLSFGSGPVPQLRAAMEMALKTESPADLAGRLGLELAEPDNPVRVIRAAENAVAEEQSAKQVWAGLGIEASDISNHTSEDSSANDIAARSELEHWRCGGIYVLDPGREELAMRIERRVSNMFSSGLLTEVEQLGRLGFSDAPVARDGIAYREALGVISGALQLSEAIELAVTRTRQYAKRQRTYFRGQGWKVAGVDTIRQALADSLVENG